MQKKRCTECKKIKPLDDFYKSKINTDGYRGKCKTCARKKRRQCYINNLSPEQSIKYNRNKKRKKLLKKGKYICVYCEEIKPLTEFHKNTSSPHGYSSICKACRNKHAKKYRVKMKQDPEWVKHRNEQVKKRYHNNIEYYRKLKRKYRNNVKNNPQFKLNSSTSSGIRYSLKGNKNNSHWEDLVGYTLKELKQHLEKQFTNEMSWKNYGKIWEIDHILPIDSFSFTKPEHIGFRKCWSLDNLRPLECSLNRSKGNKLIKDKQEYLVI